LWCTIWPFSVHIPTDHPLPHATTHGNIPVLQNYRGKDAQIMGKGMLVAGLHVSSTMVSTVHVENFKLVTFATKN